MRHPPLIFAVLLAFPIVFLCGYSAGTFDTYIINPFWPLSGGGRKVRVVFEMFVVIFILLLLIDKCATYVERSREKKNTQDQRPL